MPPSVFNYYPDLGAGKLLIPRPGTPRPLAQYKFHASPQSVNAMVHPGTSMHPAGFLYYPRSAQAQRLAEPIVWEGRISGPVTGRKLCCPPSCRFCLPDPSTKRF
ncbi:uncharacterized protein LOC144167394 [Haemaphysalis longicornis]